MSGGSPPRRRPTSTSNFGVGRREGHDASAFYERFTPPDISDDETVVAPFEIDEPFRTGDSRHLDLPDNSVALVVTSPPYFVGKDYEIDADRPEVPASYADYLRLLHEVFAECVRVLEPGGRIAVNVANLGRKPYRSLSADVIRILQDDLGLLLRGEVIWKKSEGATGNCAWGSFRSASNPVIRDITERIVIAAKGRFDRAIPVKKRAASSLPWENSVNNDEFMAATLDVWDIPPESAQRVGHPAPFPVELPERLIHLYTFEDDLVLDPFMGSGTTLLAAAKLDRRYVGCDLDSAYVDIARRRVQQAVARRQPAASEPATPARPPAATLIEPPEAGQPLTSDPGDDFQARATREGKAAQEIAKAVLERAGFQIVGRNVKARGLGVTINLVALDLEGQAWNFDVTGAFTTTRGGLLRTDSLWKALGRASVLAHNDYGPLEAKGAVVLLTSHLPRPGSDGDRALRKAGPTAFFDAVEMLSDEGQLRLAAYAAGGAVRPQPGFWTDDDLDHLD
jgi:DNA modification methylase